MGQVAFLLLLAQEQESRGDGSPTRCSIGGQPMPACPRGCGSGAPGRGQNEGKTGDVARQLNVREARACALPVQPRWKSPPWRRAAMASLWTWQWRTERRSRAQK